MAERPRPLLEAGYEYLGEVKLWWWLLSTAILSGGATVLWLFSISPFFAGAVGGMGAISLFFFFLAKTKHAGETGFLSLADFGALDGDQSKAIGVEDGALTRSLLAPESHADVKELELTVKIVEAFVIPNMDRTADCFLRVSIHNHTKVECANPLQYALSLIIDDREYSHTSRLDLHAHQLVQYKTVVSYGEDGEEFEEEKELYKEGLRPNVETTKDFLVKGKPLIGWLGLQVHYLPEWKYRKDIIRYDETESVNEDTGVVEYQYEPVYQYTPTLQTLWNLKLNVTDPYQQSWPAETSSFNPAGKKIEKRKNKGDDREKLTKRTLELDITFDKNDPQFVDRTRVAEQGVAYPCKLYRVAVINHSSSPITRLLAKGVKNLSEGRTYPPLHLRITGKAPTEKEIRIHKGEPQFWDIVEKKDSDKEWARLLETDIPNGHLLPVPSEFTITASCDDGLSITKRVILDSRDDGDLDFQVLDI